MASEQTFLTTAEAAERLTEAGLPVTQRQVQRWVNKDQIAFTRLPNRRVHIPVSAVDALIPEPAAS